MSIVRYGSVPPQPWRNGRGVTRELHVGDGWRLSIATLAEAGDFSVLDGLDRVFVLAGEDPVRAFPDGSPALAVNVMTGRPTHVADVEVRRVDGPPPEADALVVLEGEVEVGGEVLGPLDALVPSGPGRCRDALLVVVRIRRRAR